MRTVELVVTEDWFEGTGAPHANDPAFDAMRTAMQRPTVTRRKPLDARLRQVASSVLHPPGQGALERLHLESRALDLLIALATGIEPDAPMRNDSRMSGAALERIWMVRKLIDSDPAGAWSLPDTRPRPWLTQRDWRT